MRSENQIGDIGAKALANALMHNQSVTSIELSGNFVLFFFARLICCVQVYVFYFFVEFCRFRAMRLLQ